LAQSFMHALRAALLSTAAAAFVLAASSLPSLAAGKRVALVVGNAAYAAVPALAQPGNDAKAVASALRKAGFEVVTAIDLDKAGFENAIERYSRALNGADVSLLFYSGHGLSVDGENRLVPVDATLASPADLEVQTVSLQTITLYMQTRSRAQLIYLDAARGNPFATSSFLTGAKDKPKKVAKGLAELKGSDSSLIALSAAPGQVVPERGGDLSLFTEALLKHGFVANVDAHAALVKITQEVAAESETLQRPWSSVSLAEPLYLNPLSGAGQDLSTAKLDKVTRAIAVVPATLGVGPQDAVPENAVLQLGTVEKITVAKLPESGVLMLEGKPVAEGTQVAMKDVMKISFEPAPDTAAAPASFVLQTVSDTTNVATKAVEVSAATTLNPCDDLASEPLDSQGVSKGRLPNEIEIEKALSACRDAMKAFPAVGRFVFQMGRAELAAKNTKAALELFNKASGMGHLRALNQLGYMYQGGLGVERDLATANAMFKRAADKGDPYGMLSYGRNLAFGRGVKQDLDAGLAFLNHAVELGHTYAMNELGGMYISGKPVAKNPKRAIRFYELSMARGDIYGIRNMGLAYASGSGVEQDLSTALALFTKASKGGHPAAPTDIGAMYFNGSGVEKNFDEALKWYAIGAERGNVAAAANLGWIHSEGPEGTRNVAKAVEYTALAVALDLFDRDKSLRPRLAALPDDAKKAAVKQLIKSVGPEAAQTAEGLDETLVLLARKAWTTRNPRIDLF
jgi:TPR repeat protein